MARLVPSELDLAPAADAGREAERKTLLRLRDGLSDAFTVYHGTHWARGLAGGSVYGEIDFIVADREGRLLAIEQKLATVWVRNGELFARYRDQADPGRVISQLSRNLNGLRGEYARRHPGQRLTLDHLLYLPQARLAGATPSGIDPSRVIDADRDAQLIDIVTALIEAASPPSGPEAPKALDVHDFLAQQVCAEPSIGVLGRSARELSTRLSDGLATWAQRLSLSPWRLRVQGTAGSGKTQLALAELREAHRWGSRALYLCFNRPLADAMRQAAPAAETVFTFHEFARVVMTQAGMALPDFAEPRAFESLAEGFIALSSRLTGLFDTLVIDEGQDFEPAWVAALLGLAGPDARVLWLEDPDQTLYRRAAVDLSGWPVLRSPVNYRSPRRLVEFMNALGLTPAPLQAGSAVDGFDPRWLEHDDGADPLAVTADALGELRVQGYLPAHTVVLSYRGLASSRLFRADAPAALAGLRLRKPDGHDDQGQARFTDGDLLVDSLFRFKGQAADAVVITEIDFEILDETVCRRLFVALTRARLHAVLITSARAGALLRERLAQRGWDAG
ncbi:MAG: AAA family ATPase [Betaproteobacteria bacterium]|nr:AAA family ATPase [Betaproteobacteria bacterium]